MTNLIKHWIFYVQQNQRIKHSFEMELNVLSRVQIISNPPTLSSIVHVTGNFFCFSTCRLTSIFIGHFTYISMGFWRSFLPFIFTNFWLDPPFFNHYERPYYNFIGHFWLCLFKYRFDFLAISKTEFLMSRNEIFYQNFFYLATYWILAYIFNCQIHIQENDNFGTKYCYSSQTPSEWFKR